MTTFLPHLLSGALLLVSQAVAAPSDSLPAKSHGMPTARIKGNVICCPGERVVLDGWASIDIGGEIAAWMWDYNSDGTTDTVSSTGELVVAAPRNSKVYAIALRVRDNQGNISQPDTATVHVMDVGPTVRVRSDTTVKVGVRVQFEPRISWVCARPVRFEWDFDGDGQPEYHSERDGNTSRVYYTPGRYIARFYVVDAVGHKAGGMSAVTVTGRHGEQASATPDSAAAAPEL